jgi:hypothetical protein
MPWRQVDAMTERLRFVRDARQRLVTFTELCALCGISRVTGYKWLERANASGLDFLQELSRRPHSLPHVTPPHCRRDCSRHAGVTRAGGPASCWPWCVVRIGAAGSTSPGPPGVQSPSCADATA